MAGFGIINTDWLTLPWEQARNFVKEELESLRLVISRRWGFVFGPDNTINVDAISGNGRVVPRYVANTGKNFKPQWDLVDVQSGVKNRLQFANFKAATLPSVLLGRESGSAGNFEQISLAGSLRMEGVVLTDGGAAGAFMLADGIYGEDGPPGPPGISGGAGSVGPTGPTGATGAAGAPAIDGLDGEDWGAIPGPVGPTGAMGATGATGPSGTGIMGPMGDDGPMGEQGFPGPQGIPGASVEGARQEGRLTLASGTPVSTTDQIGKTTFYWTPCDASLQSITTGVITLWSGSALVDVGVTEITKALGTLTSGKNYNVYLDYNAGTPQLIIGAAWTNDTTMSETLAAQYDSSRKATIITLSGTPAYRFVGAFRTTSTTTTEDSTGGSVSQTGGKRFLANAYNVTRRNIGVIDTTDTWSYTTNTIRQANGASGNKVEFLLALSNILVEGQVIANIAVNNNSARAAKAGIGLDTTTAFSGAVGAGMNVGGSQEIVNMIGTYGNYPGLGYHYLSWNEKGADGTSLFIGDDGGDSSQSGMGVTLLN